RYEGRRARINIDALAPSDLNQTLAWQVGVIVDLGVRRGDQDIFLMTRDPEVRHLRSDFLEHVVDEGTVATIHGADVPHAEPEAPAGNRFHDLSPAEITDLAFAPDSVGTAGAGLHEIVAVARITLDQFG